MPRPVDSSALTEVSAVLQAVSGTVAGIEDNLLSCLVTMGEPDAQSTVDGWVDQVVDLLRAVDEVTDQHLMTLSRVSLRRGDHGSVGQHDASRQQNPSLPVGHR